MGDVVVLGRSRPDELRPRLGSRPELVFVAGPALAELGANRAGAELGRPRLVLQAVVDARVERLGLVAAGDALARGAAVPGFLGEQKRGADPTSDRAGRE